MCLCGSFDMRLVWIVCVVYMCFSVYTVSPESRPSNEEGSEISTYNFQCKAACGPVESRKTYCGPMAYGNAQSTYSASCHGEKANEMRDTHRVLCVKPCHELYDKANDTEGKRWGQVDKHNLEPRDKADDKEDIRWHLRVIPTSHPVMKFARNKTVWEIFVNERYNIHIVISSVVAISRTTIPQISRHQNHNDHWSPFVLLISL